MSKDVSLSNLPGGDYLETVLGWIQAAIVPNSELWWLWLLTFPLTIIWMIWSSAKMKEFFNTTGGVVLLGTPALAILLAFYGIPAMVFMKIFGGATALVSFVMNPSGGAFLDILVVIFKTFLVLLVIWILQKLPGVTMVVTKVLGFGKDIAGKVWSYRSHSQEHPNVGYQILGAAVIAGLVNGQFITNLTADVAFPGMIPGASALVGFYFLLYRTVFGQRMVMKATSKVKQKPGPNGQWLCNNPTFKHNRKGEIYFEGQEKPIHYSKLQAALKKGLKPVMVKCGTMNAKEDKFCRSEWCDCQQPFLNWKCSSCGYEGEGQQSVVKGSGKAKDKVVTSYPGIPWDTDKCPHCGKRREKLKEAKPVTPDTDQYSRKTEEEKTPAKKPEAKKKTPQKKPSTRSPIMDNLRTGNDVILCRKCFHQNPGDSMYCERCGTELFLMTVDEAAATKQQARKDAEPKKKEVKPPRTDGLNDLLW
jgi:hypothetical protein